MSAPDQPTPPEVAALAAWFAAARYAEAASAAQTLTARFPQEAIGWKALGVAWMQLGRAEEAVAPLETAAALAPADAEAQSNLGAVLQHLGRSAEAVLSLRRAVTLKPELAATHNNLGAALNNLGHSTEAVACYRRALALAPNLAEAHDNLGTALKDLAQLEKAAASYRRALALAPHYAAAHNNLGSVLKDLGRHADAVASFQRALEIDPNLTRAQSNLLLTRLYQSDPRPAAVQLAEARRFGDLAAQQARPYTDWPNARQPQRCLRIGLVSGDLGQHAVGFFLEGLLAALPAQAAEQLEFFAYATWDRDDALTARLRACCRGWVAVAALTDAALAERIRSDGIDILLDLGGHTKHNRLAMFAWKPAPVQASWLGYLGTTGMAAMDYLIADPTTLPESEDPYFTEKIWRLPESYLCFTPPAADGEVSALPALAHGHVTFGCCNDLAKLNEAVIALWARVLQAVPASRLLLTDRRFADDGARRHVAESFAAHGLDPQRLQLEGAVPERAEHLARYQRVDIALDPFPYPGITTSVEALWMGVPVLTLAGERWIARQGVGLLTHAGLPEWIAVDADDYVARAAAHAADLPRLAALRKGLRQQVLASPLGDAPRFARHFSAALRGMWTQWCTNRCGG